LYIIIDVNIKCFFYKIFCYKKLNVESFIQRLDKPIKKSLESSFLLLLNRQGFAQKLEKTC